MIQIKLGNIIKITGSKIICSVCNNALVNKISVDNFNLNYISIGALAGTKLVDGRTLIITIEEIYENNFDIFFIASINGIYDEVLRKYSFGTNSYPLINEVVFKLDNNVLGKVFEVKLFEKANAKIGKYFYDENVAVNYNPNVIFGKHLGVFGNTGSGKTCTVVSLIQNYIRNNDEKDIKFIILDVNGEYKTAFNENECEYFDYKDLRFNHHILNNAEYGKLFRASEGIQYPALKDVIRNLSQENKNWHLNDLPDELEKWTVEKASDDKNGSKEKFSINQISGFLRTMVLRIEQILNDFNLMNIIDSDDEISTLDIIKRSDKKVFILDLQTSLDSLDIVLYLFFKSIYLDRTMNRISTHNCLVLEEAHRYINANVQETQLGTYYIDKLSREGRKFGIGLIISSQVPSMLSYEIVSQCNSVIMHKITNKRDLEFLKGVMRISNDSFYLQMSSLEKQYAIVCGEAFPNDTIVKIEDAFPLPMSNDPIIQDKLL